MSVTRRQFAAGILLPLAAPGQPRSQILIQGPSDRNFLAQLAARELLRGLTRLLPGTDIRLAGGAASGKPIRFRLEVGSLPVQDPETYSIAMVEGTVLLRGATPQALLYSVFDLLERQGAFFGIDGESYPLDPPADLILPAESSAWASSPRFKVRGLLPWPDFLNCITVYNDEDFRAYFEAMMRMRFNTFGMHVYTQGSQWAESYLSFEFAGVGHLGFLDNTASHRWGYLPQRTSRYGMGASQFYAAETFGSDATMGRNAWEIADATRDMLSKSLDYARKLGMKTGVGFEPYQIPDEILRALPPEVKPSQQPGRQSSGVRFDIESITAKKMLEARLGNLLESYPNVDHVWLWEDEGMNWESRKTGIPMSVTPFLQAHDFLKRNAPDKRLVVSGWGGVARHFADFHRRLPGDIVFSCLSDTLGWDPVHEVFGKLEGRERWPIPWLEDDPAMWLPQFHVHRFERDLNLAEQYGCQGMIGIHWRHRIVDPTAGYMARFSWDKKLEAAAYYRAYARTHAAGERAAKLAATLTDADKNRTLLSTGTDEVKDGHVVQHEFSGDYSEAFTFWNNYEPEPRVVASQKEVAAALAALVNDASSAEERERLAYLSRHVEFLVPYTEAWILAHRMHGVLEKAAKLRGEGRKDDAKSLVEFEALPLWLNLAPEVRKAMLLFQSIVATRNDQGTLASMQNKFVRLSLDRLPLSLQEFLGEMPEQVRKAVIEARKADASEPSRLIVPTRPTLLGAEDQVRLLVLATGPAAPGAPVLHTRLRGQTAWKSTPMRLLGRRTYEAALGPFQTGGALAEYYVSADFGAKKLTVPLDAPKQVYRITLA